MRFLRNLLRQEDTPDPASDPALPVAPACQTRLRVGWATDVGKTRRHNEDTALVVIALQDGDEPLPEFGLFVLADGMGGHQAGEIASSLAARTAAHHVLQRLYLPSLIKQEHGTDQPALNEVIVNAVQEANNVVARQVPGGGTTLTCNAWPSGIHRPRG